MMKIMIGIPCFKDVSGETLEDYMRLAYYCGRRMPQYEFILGVKTKTEQFRARNAIVEGAIQLGVEYLFFIDDDHVIDWEVSPGPNSRYGLIDQLVQHCEKDPSIGVVGALYYHRGGECRPVLMREGKDGGTYWMLDHEIKGELQEVAVQGGGCMLLRMSMFDKLKSPWFEPEHDLGTDIQICKKAKEAGYKVCCDTSIQIGHVMSKREIVTPNNRHRIAIENGKRGTDGDQGINAQWLINSALALYRMDAEDYLGMKYEQMGEIARKYDMKELHSRTGGEYGGEGLKEYYATRGKEQLARQVLFHHTPHMVEEMEMFHNMINTTVEGRGLDFGCGSAPVTFELVMRGHNLDFVDIDGSGAYEFTKWRAKKRGVESRVGWKIAEKDETYDYVFMLDSIEHIEDWRGVLSSIIPKIKQKGVLITNYFLNMDYDNPEHISMDKGAVEKFLTENGVYPLNKLLWVRHPLGADK